MEKKLLCMNIYLIYIELTWTIFSLLFFVSPSNSYKIFVMETKLLYVWTYIYNI